MNRCAWKVHTYTPRSCILVQLRYIVGFGLVEIAISTNPKPTIYRNLYENTGPVFLAHIHENIRRCPNAGLMLGQCRRQQHLASCGSTSCVSWVFYYGSFPLLVLIRGNQIQIEYRGS